MIGAAALDLEGERAIGAEDDLPWLHACGQLLVSNGNTGLVALEVVVCDQLEILALFQFDLATSEPLLEETSANLRALRVQENGHWFIRALLARLPDALYCFAMS